MRRPPIGPRGLAFPLALTLAVSLLIAVPASTLGQASKKAAPPDNRPLARYVYRDNLVIYAGSEGLDAHAEAWQKTAAYKLLNETSLGAMLEDITTQLGDQALAVTPNRKLNGADVLAIIKHMAKSGFVLAVNAPEKGAVSPSDIGVFVVRGAAGKLARGPFSRLMGTFMGAAKPKPVMKSGRYVVTIPIPAGKAGKDEEAWSWWAEKNDDLVVVMGKGNDDVVIEIIDGKKPNALANPVRVELAKPEGGFTAVGQLFFDPAAVAKSADPTGGAAKVIALGVTRFDYRWGFQGDALMTVARFKAPRPRRGPLALFDQPSFDKGKLPPLPEGIESFTVVSVAADKAYENLLAAASTPEQRAKISSAADTLKAKTRVDLRKDLLAHLGNRFAFYAMPGGAPATSTAPAAAGVLPGAAGPFAGMLGMGAIPRFTLTAEVDDNAAFIRTLDNLMTGFNKVAREQAAAAEAAPPPEAGGALGKAAQPKARGGPAPEFKMTPSSNPAERSYVLNIPPSMARQFPAGYRPTIRLLKKQLVVSTTPESARLAIEVKADEWVPPADLAPAFDPLPKELIVLGARDPRSTLPENLASLPATIQRAVNTAFAGAGADAPGIPGLPGAGGGGGAGAAPPPMLVFNIPMSRLPKPDELRERLFPGSFAVAADDQEVQIISRLAFPAVVSPSSVSMLAVAMPAIQAARMAAAQQAQAAAAAGATAPAPAAPGTAKSAKPGAATKSGRASTIPKD